MMDEWGFVLVQKEKDRLERKKERQERKIERVQQGETFLSEVETLLNTCSAPKAQIMKALKNCLRQDRNRFA